MTKCRLILCLCLSAASSACSLYLDGERAQCKVDSDCAALGSSYASYVCRDSMCQAPVDPTWACIDSPSSEEPASGKVHVAMTMVDLLSQKPLSGVTLTLCAKLDGTCMLPIDNFVSDEAGRMDVEMNAGFDGYFQAEGAGIYPTLIFPPNTRRQRAPSTLPMVPASFFGVMYKGIGVSVAEDRSVVLTTALDCLGRPAAGVAVASPQADDRTVGYVLAGGVPSRTAPATDETGVGGFVNIPAGSAVITSTLTATNRVVGTAGVQTRSGHLSMVLVMPSGG
jgi:hypothetical protein